MNYYGQGKFQEEGKNRTKAWEKAIISAWRSPRSKMKWTYKKNIP